MIAGRNIEAFVPVDLQTREGALVAVARLPAFAVAPMAIRFGARTFLRRAAVAPLRAGDRYSEIFSYDLPAADIQWVRA